MDREIDVVRLYEYGRLHYMQCVSGTFSMSSMVMVSAVESDALTASFPSISSIFFASSRDIPVNLVSESAEDE